eukprot:14548632-Alexandrium_andersonii.AAC.1
MVTQRRGGRTLLTEEGLGAKVEVPGTWYTMEKYPYGDYKARKHKSSMQIDPLTKKRRRMIFVPDNQAGTFRGSLYSDSSVRDKK